jgi:hypothetical protein
MDAEWCGPPIQLISVHEGTVTVQSSGKAGSGGQPVGRGRSEIHAPSLDRDLCYYIIYSFGVCSTVRQPYLFIIHVQL